MQTHRCWATTPAWHIFQLSVGFSLALCTSNQESVEQHLRTCRLPHSQISTVFVFSIPKWGNSLLLATRSKLNRLEFSFQSLPLLGAQILPHDILLVIHMSILTFCLHMLTFLLRMYLFSLNSLKPHMNFVVSVSLSLWFGSFCHWDPWKCC